MYTYFVIFKTAEQVEPVGIFIVDLTAPPAHAMLWSHWQKAWRYDPPMVDRVLADEDNFDRWSKVNRETAERLTPQITGGETLPSEDWIRWAFEWRGNPPEPEDDDPELEKLTARIRAKREAAERERAAENGDDTRSGNRP